MLQFRRWSMCLIAAALLAVPLRAAAYEKYLPDDTEAVIRLNIKQVMAAPMLKDALAGLHKMLAGDVDAQKMLKEIGFDPLKDLDHVVIAIPGSGNVEKTVLLVTGKFDAAKIEAAAEKAGQADLKVHKIGSNKAFEIKVPIPQLGEQAFFLCIIDGTTIAVAGNKEGISDTLDRRDGKKKSKLKKEMADLLAKVDPKLSLSVTVLGTVAGQAEVSDRINYLTGGISLTDEAKAEFVIAAKNADTAKELQGLITEGLQQGKQILSFMAANQKQLAPLVDLLGVIKVDAAGSIVTLKGQLTKDEIEKAIKKAGG